MISFGRIGQALRGLAVLGVAAVLALPLSTGSVAARQSGPTGQPAAGKTTLTRPIVFSSQANSVVGSTFNLYKVDADGLNRTNLTASTGSTSDLDPAWSPDSSAIAFSAACPAGGRCLYMIKADGTLLRQLTFGESQTDAQPAWALDQQHLVFVSDRDGSRQLWTLGVMDGRLHQLTTSDGLQNPQNPSWSPDGTTIVFANGGNLYLIGSNGTQMRPFVISGKARMPDWSPDGTRIAYVDGESVWVRSVDGKSNTLVGRFSAASSPHWSPNGNQLVLSARDAGGSAHLYLVDLLGDWVKQVTLGLYDDISPDW